MSQLPNRDEAQDESITEESPFPAQLLQNSQSIAISRSPIAQSHFNNTTSSTPYTSQTLHSAHNSSKQTPDGGTSGGLDPPNTADMDGDSSKDLFELYGENSSLREELEKLKPEKMRLETQVNNQEAHIEVVEEENKRLKEVNDRLQTSYTELEADTTAKIEEFEKLEQAHNSLLGQVNGTDRKKGKIENILKDTKRSLQEARDLNKVYREKLDGNPNDDAYLAEAERMLTEVNGLREELTKLKNVTLHEKDVRINDQKAANKKLKNENRNLSKEVEKLKAGKAKLRESIKRNQAEAAQSKIPDGHASPEHTTDDETTSEMSHDMEVTPRQLVGRSVRSEIGSSTGSRDHSPTKSTFGSSTRSEFDANEGAEEARPDDITITWTSKDVIGQEVEAQTGTVVEPGAGDQTATGSNEDVIDHGMGSQDGLFEVGDVWDAGRLPATQGRKDDIINKKMRAQDGVGEIGDMWDAVHLPATQGSEDTIDDGMGGQDWVGKVADDWEVGHLPATQGSEDIIYNRMGGKDGLSEVGDKHEIGHSTTVHIGDDAIGQATKAHSGAYEIVEKLGKAEFWTGKKIAGVVVSAGLAAMFFALCYFWWTQANAAKQERSIWTNANMIGGPFHPYTKTQVQRKALYVIGMMTDDARARAGYFSPAKTIQFYQTMTNFVSGPSRRPR